MICGRRCTKRCPAEGPRADPGRQPAAGRPAGGRRRCGRRTAARCAACRRARGSPIRRRMGRARTRACCSRLRGGGHPPAPGGPLFDRICCSRRARRTRERLRDALRRDGADRAHARGGLAGGRSEARACACATTCTSQGSCSRKTRCAWPAAPSRERAAKRRGVWRARRSLRRRTDASCASLRQGRCW